MTQCVGSFCNILAMYMLILAVKASTLSTIAPFWIEMQPDGFSLSLCVSLLVFSLLPREVVEPLHVERPEMECRRVIKLADEENDVRPPATSADPCLSLEEYGALVYKGEAPPLGCVHISLVKKGKPSSSVIMTERQSKKVMRTSFEEERVKIGAEFAPEV